jgi:hypothetical protein
MTDARSMRALCGGESRLEMGGDGDVTRAAWSMMGQYSLLWCSFLKEANAASDGVRGFVTNEMN